MHVLTTIDRFSSVPLSGEEARLISILLSIPLRGTRGPVVPRHRAITIFAVSARHSRIRVPEEDLRGPRYLSITITVLTLFMQCLLTLLTAEDRAHCTPIIMYVDALLCYVYLQNLRMKTTMTNKPDIPRQSLGDFRAAQNSHQGHRGVTGWDPQMTQSLVACALQSSLGAAIPPQQSPPKVGTPVKYQRSCVHARPILAYSRICQTRRPLQPSHHNPPPCCPTKMLPPSILLLWAKKRDQRKLYWKLRQRLVRFLNARRSAAVSRSWNAISTSDTYHLTSTASNPAAMQPRAVFIC